ncbi:MAG: C40 family peptidase [Clostridiales bacterium]|nr:C40 family peptidase [Clostridiales bacterium]
MRKIDKIRIIGCLCAILGGGTLCCQTVSAEVVLVAAQQNYANIAVSQVTDYVNIREQATTSSAIVGKIYNNCAATILESVSGEGGEWYRIQSGTVTGYIKAQYFITGEAAEQLAQSIGREFATITTDSLRLREAPSLDSTVLTLLSNGARYVVAGEEGDFYKIEVDADLVGYIAKAYCTTEVEFDQALSLEEEQQKLAEETQRKQEADDAIAALQQVIEVETGLANGGATSTSPTEFIIEANPEVSDNSQRASAPTVGVGSVLSGSSSPGSTAAVVSATRTAIVAYARQFLGNPYVYGGTSLTDGADCSGFTQAIYAHFGIETGRSSRDQAENGQAIAVDAAQPGDLLFYASGDYINHVALYIGGGQVIHASNETTGIIISPYNYRTPCKAVSFLD